MGASIRELGYNIKESKERLILEADNSSVNISTNKTAKTGKELQEKKNNCMDISSNKLTKSHIQEDLDMTTKGKPQESNWISSYIGTKQHH